MLKDVNSFTIADTLTKFYGNRVTIKPNNILKILNG